MQTTTVTLPDRAKAVGTLASEHADWGDQNGRLAEPVVEALHKEGLYGMWVPRSLGGAELDPVSSLQVIENLAYGDPSTGWVLMAAALAIGTGAAYLEDEAVDQLFSGSRLPTIVAIGHEVDVSLAELAAGEDSRPVQPGARTRSISAERRGLLVT